MAGRMLVTHATGVRFSLEAQGISSMAERAAYIRLTMVRSRYALQSHGVIEAYLSSKQTIGVQILVGLLARSLMAELYSDTIQTQVRFLSCQRGCRIMAVRLLLRQSMSVRLRPSLLQSRRIGKVLWL